MKSITPKTYRKDKYYPRVVRAVGTILQTVKVVTPIEVFRNMDLLTAAQILDWRRGRIPYLERAINCSLAKASRILRILDYHARLDRSLYPSWTGYRRKTPSGKIPLRFSKSGHPRLEEAYSRHFIHPCLKEKKQAARGGASDQPRIHHRGHGEHREESRKWEVESGA